MGELTCVLELFHSLSALINSIYRTNVTFIILLV